MFKTRQALELPRHSESLQKLLSQQLSFSSYLPWGWWMLQQGQDLPILHLLLRFVESLVKRKTCDLHWAVWHQENCKLELCYKTSILLIEDVERLKDLVLDTLHNPHTGLLLLPC